MDELTIYKSPHTLCRRSDPLTSYEAAKKASKKLPKQAREVLFHIKTYVNCVESTFTTKDIGRFMADGNNQEYHLNYGICRRRFSDLHEAKEIELTGGKKEGCNVYKLKG